jgi:hypothetical protein
LRVFLVDLVWDKTEGISEQLRDDPVLVPVCTSFVKATEVHLLMFGIKCAIQYLGWYFTIQYSIIRLGIWVRFCFWHDCMSELTQHMQQIWFSRRLELH